MKHGWGGRVCQKTMRLNSTLVRPKLWVLKSVFHPCSIRGSLNSGGFGVEAWARKRYHERAGGSNSECAMSASHPKCVTAHRHRNPYPRRGPPVLPARCWSSVRAASLAAACRRTTAHSASFDRKVAQPTPAEEPSVLGPVRRIPRKVSPALRGGGGHPPRVP